MSSISRVAVELGARRYEVVIGPALIARLGELLRANGLKQTNAFVITNADVAGHYFTPIETALQATGFQRVVRHDIPSTEEGKSWEVFSDACAALLKAFPDAGASPLVLLLGGGVVGDLGGFAAAVFRRGVPFVQIPTTLLAAVDSSVGGKVAVNFGGVKNIMGAFNQPSMVVCDLSTLDTLSGRELRSGTAEIIKYGAVCSAPLFEQLERGDLEKILVRDPTVLADIVTQCVALKARVVEQDEFDKKSIRNVLNFGHTIGHGLELSADYELTHGEAISIGMVAATKIARELSMIDESFAERLTSLFVRAGLPTHFPGHADLFDRVKRALQLDKKFREGRNVFVLPTGIGKWEQRENIEWALVDEAIRSAIA